LRTSVTEIEIKLQRKSIARLELHWAKTVQLEDSVLGELILCEEGLPDIRIRDSWIGKLRLAKNSVGSLDISGGGIDEISCPRPGGENPFRGSVSVKSVWLSRDFKNAQAYRNLRHYMRSMHNLETAAVFHSAELKTLYHQHHRLDKAFNWLYEAASDYGNSTLRPIVWFAVFAVANIALFWITDGAVVSLDENERIGWRTAFVGSGGWEIASRAFLITLTQTFNPLGIFGRGFLVPATTLLAAFNLVVCFFATLCLAFFAFALRRRFRISDSS
jgi:hypothetical protein